MHLFAVCESQVENCRPFDHFLSLPSLCTVVYKTQSRNSVYCVMILLVALALLMMATEKGAFNIEGH